MTFQTETDLTVLNSLAARQPDSDRFRLWEVAGTAHADTYTVGMGMTDLGDSPEAAEVVLVTEPVPGFGCPEAINSGPQHFVLKAAVAALHDWVRDGTPPPQAPRLEVAGSLPARILRDANGNALGGIRTPHVDVPIATLSGDPQGGSLLCLLFGSTAPFDATRLADLYPDHESYVAAVHGAADQAVREGFLLPPDAELVKAAAEASDIGS